MEITIQASEFKNKCLQLLNDVHSGDTYLITKRGVPFAKLSALKSESVKLFGIMKNSFSENENITMSINEPWDVEND
jgi:prevent-host-death family protein